MCIRPVHRGSRAGRPCLLVFTVHRSPFGVRWIGVSVRGDLPVNDQRPATTMAVIPRTPKITGPSTSSPNTQCDAKIAKNGNSNCT